MDFARSWDIHERTCFSLNLIGFLLLIAVALSLSIWPGWPPRLKLWAQASLARWRFLSLNGKSLG